MSKVRENLEELATQILIDNDMLYKVPVDIIKIAKAYGINVYLGEFENEISGAIRYNAEEESFEILVNKNNAKVRQRFTIAHELGHYFLHKDILMSSDVHIDTLYRLETKTNGITKEREKEVDYFAGALLINKIAVKTLLEKGYNVKEIADILNVSISAMAVRLDILDIL